MRRSQNPQPNRSGYGSEDRFFRQAIYPEPLHLVDVSNQIHRNDEKTISCKLQKEFSYVMLIHNKWGVPTGRKKDRGTGAFYPGGFLHA